MANNTIEAGLDLGSDTFKCVVASSEDDGLVSVIGTGIEQARGIKNGVICNRDEVIQSIRKVVDQAERVSGCRIDEVHVALSPQFFKIFPAHGVTRIRKNQVTQRDVNAVIEMARTYKLSPDSEFIHILPHSYEIDDQTDLTDPIGMSGVRLEVQAQAVIAQSAALRNFGECCRQAHLHVVDIYMPSLANAEALLGQNDREVGVALIDMGRDSVDLSIFKDRNILFNMTFNMGGDDITYDIKDHLRIPYSEAEHIKNKYGAASNALSMNNESIELSPVGGQPSSRITRHKLCDIIDARLCEMLAQIREAFDATLPQNFLLAGGIVLTGGCAHIEGLPELVKEELHLSAAVGEIKGIRGLVDVVKDPRFATATGLALCGIRQCKQHWFSQRNEPRRFGFFSDWF